MNVGEAIVKTLEDIGVDRVFAGSGQSDSDILFALAESDDIETVIIRNEQGGSFMACGYSMFTEKLGVVVTTAGPGAVNIISGMCVAYSDSLPILGITGYAPVPARGKGDLGESTGLYRTPDTQRMFEACTKKSVILEKPEDTLDVLEDLINTAYEGRWGPVHLHLPYDISLSEVEYRPIDFQKQRVEPTPKKVAQFAEVLARALKEGKKVAAIFGYGAIRSGAEDAAAAFVDKFQIPFMTTMDAKGIIPENHPLSMGMPGIATDPGARQTYLDADIVIAVGNSFAKWSCWKWDEGLFGHAQLMHINVDKEAIGRVYDADYHMAADARLALEAVTAELEGKVSSPSGAWAKRDKHHDEVIEYDGDKVHPGMLVQKLSGLLPERAVVLGDAGGHMLWLSCYLSLNGGQIYQNPGTFGPMASHVNAAVGVAAANPDRRVIAGVGDGDWQMAGWELMTAVQNRIPVVWIVFNNGEFNIIKYMQMRTHGGREVFNRILGPDLKAVAEACGAHGVTVTELEEFEPAFRAALECGGPAVIDVHVESEVYPPFALLHEEHSVLQR
ncbi:MAG: thiamine pyrophosphate-binding protein [Armatimonadia bacterium]|nr:thiamine pyrophosphate-binding protein [Armatimonadia bacterium]